MMNCQLNHLSIPGEPNDMRASGTPLLLTAQGKATTLEGIPMGCSGVEESRPQALLDENPSILPVDKFEGTFGPLASLGREIMGIDNLSISPNGRLTVVKTKP